ncbi:MAG: hypothetical protein LBH36_02590 [Candidatus Nomurabacteria bacterium]|jgi:acetate kinase|nr:hypothetical protein [Candidatus Nomurabacteria bacterium]
MEKTDRLLMIVNPGSASRKTALYRGEELQASLHFEFVNGKVICTLRDAEDNKTPVPVEIGKIDEALSHAHGIFAKHGYLHEDEDFDGIVIRVVAPGDYFAKDHVVDDEFMSQLGKAKMNAPLHAPVTEREIIKLRESFGNLQIIAVSDSAFHATKPKLMQYYPFDTEVADLHSLKRYGYHGLSVASLVRYMKEHDILADKTIVCHIGSGSSITAVYQGKSIDNSMGFSPLEGVMMSTRAGSMDVAVALRLKQHLGLSDEGLEEYLNKKSGLLGVSGSSDDMRLIVKARDEESDARASFAFALYVHRIQCVVGQMAAEMNGVDAIVFSGTVGERGFEVRHPIMEKLDYLGFNMDYEKNDKTYLESGHANLAASEEDKPIYVIRTDEARQMVYAANQLLDSVK